MSRAARAPSPTLRLCVAVGVALILLRVFEPRAVAQTISNVILDGRGSAQLARKIRAELVYLGLSVTAAPAARARPPVADRLASSEARALMQIESPDRVEVVLAADAEHPAVRYALERRDGEGEAFALRVVEELRARLVDLGLARPASSSEVARERTPSAAVETLPTEARGNSIARSTPPAPDEDRSQPADERFPDFSLWLDAGIAGVAATGGVGPLLGGAFGAHVALGDLDLGVEVLVPLDSADVSAAAGEAEVRLGAFGAEVGYARPLATHWTLRGGAGAGLFMLLLQSEPEPGFIGNDDRLLTGHYYLHAGCAWRATRVLGLAAALGVGFSAPRPVLRFDDRPVASFGPTFGTLTLEAQIGWPSAPASSP